MEVSPKEMYCDRWRLSFLIKFKSSKFAQNLDLQVRPVRKQEMCVREVQTDR